MTTKFSIYPGDTPRLTGRVLESVGGPPFDISGYAITLVGPTFELAGAVDSGPAGTYHADMTQAATESYAAGYYPFRVLATLGASQYTVAAGKFRILDV